MKIGVITWFTGSNYGTNFQAIALQYYLRGQGHEVNVINYEIPPSSKKRPFIKRLLNQPRKYLFKIGMKRYEGKIAERDEKLFNAIKNKCILTKKINNKEELIEVCNSFDLLICGSDQIWNPNWYDRFYFADFDEINTKRISYAPSMGVNSIPKKIIPEIKRSINKLSCVSVREEKAADLLAPYLCERPEVVVDPTLLLTQKEWTNIFPEKQHEAGEFILAFFLNDEKAHLFAAKKFAKEQNCKLIIVPYKGNTYFQNVDIRADAGLEEILDLIRSARYILTDSFHMTVFSIIYRKQFYTFQRFEENEFTSQNVRVINLLDLMNLSERLIPYQSRTIRKKKHINYDDHIKKLNLEIEKSKIFLEKAITDISS